MTDHPDRPHDAAEGRYWQERLVVVTDACRIESPATQPLAPVHEALSLDSDCAARLQALARGHFTAMFTLACAGLTAALSYFLGRNAVILKTPPCAADAVAGATGALPLVVETRGHADLRAFLGHVKRVVTDGFLHASDDAGMDIDTLMAASNVGLRMEGFSDDFPSSDCPDCEFRFDGVDTLSVSSSTACMTARQARSALAMWAHCLGRFDRLEQSLSVDTVYPAELLRDIREMSCAASIPFDATTLIEQLEASFSMPGDRIAVRDAEGELSYMDLDRLSSSLAAHLATTMGIGPGARVGIMLPRSRRMLIALLAVIRAGASFVPMSCDWSSSRCTDILRQTQAALLMIDSPMMMDVLEYGVPAYVLDLQLPTLMDAPAPALPRDPESVAYIMFTSGSSGTPKGVEVRHRNIANTLAWRRICYGLQPSHVNLQIPPMYFDSAIEDVLSFLVSGSCLLLPVEDQRLQVDHLRGLLARTQATHVMLVPAIYQRLLATEPALFEGFECITLAGEAVAESLVREHFRHHPSVRLFNEYGPTENAVCSTAAELFDNGQPPSIGRAIANTFVYVVDEALQPVVPGCPGELLVGGEGVAKGYLGNEELTRERFVSLDWLRGERAYRTGDRGRYAEDGALEYLGRIDDTMVKVNGVRIELGEIESCMLAHAQVMAAVVGLDESGSLLAVFTGSASEDELRQWLGRRLPQYMWPRSVACLQELPLLGNGKVDRSRALADGQRHAMAQAKSGIAPRTATEAVLVEVWRDVLQDPGIGVTDNYFRCGGDSIRAIQITAAIAHSLGVTVSMAELYALPSVEQLAHLVEQRASIEDSTGPEPASPAHWRLDTEEFARLEANSQSVFPISDVSLGMLYHALRDADSSVYHDQTAFFVSDIDLTPKAVEGVLVAMCAAHPALRTTFHLDHAVPMQAVAADASPELHCEDWRGLSRDEQDRSLQHYLRADRCRAFTPEKSPPWRMAVFDCGTRGFAIAMSLHHALMDGWSSALFWDEFFRRLQGAWVSPEALDRDAASCRDLVVEQAELACDAGIRAYWAKELADARPFELPGQRGESARAEVVAREIATRLDPRIAARVRQLAGRLGIAVRHCYLLGYLVALSRVSYEQDFVAGIVDNVRPQKAGGERVLGCFLNTVPLRFPLDFSTPASDLLHALDARITELKHFGRASLPTILDACGYNGATPLLSSVFVYLNFHVIEDTRKAVRIEPDVFGHDRANTALDLIINESGAHAELKLKYDACRVSAELASGFIVAFTNALELMTLQPDAPLSLPDIVDGAKSRLYGGPAAPYRHPIALIRTAAVRHPDAAAYLAEDGSAPNQADMLAMVDSLAARLLPCLTSQGRQARIALMFARRDRHLLAMLATLAVGACFVPVDADTPHQRLASMLEDAEVDLILTDTELQHALPLLHWSEWLAMPTPDVPLPPEQGRDALAYILFTSGSTGRAKGVAVRLEGLSNLMQSASAVFAIGSGSRCLQFSAVSFDASIHEMLIPLGSGATVCFVPDAARRDVTQLAECIVASQVDNVVLTPSVATLLDWAALPQVRTLITVGEPPLPSVARTWSQGRRYVNAYGPAEATVCTCAFVGEPEGTEDSVPIGVPLAGVIVDIVDARRQPMLAGALGEIAISGCNVAQGYVGHAAVDGHGFAMIAADGHEHAYFSGDLGHVDAAARLHFAGRRDAQIKRNGVRIDRDGIVALALKCDRVDRAAVLFDGSLLALFVVPNPSMPAIDGRDVERAVSTHLQVDLGASMLPDLIVAVEDMPRLPSGKLDERALWALLREGEDGDGARELSTAFRDIVEQVLGHRRFDASQDFMSAGGDSLRSIRLAAAFQKAFPDADVPSIADITNAASLSELDDILRRGVAASVRPENTRPPVATVALTRAQQRLVALSLFGPGADTYNLPAAVELRGAVRRDILVAAINALIRMHPILMSRLDFSGDDARLQLRDADDFELALDVDAGEDASFMLRAFVARPFDLMQDNLARFGLIRSGGESMVLAMSLHHAIADGLSIEILLEDLFEAYATLAAGKPLSARPSAQDLGDHAACEARWLDSDDGLAAEAFWRAQLSRLRAMPALPRNATTSGRDGAGHVRVEVPGNLLTEYLKNNTKDSEFDVFLAGFGAWLASATGADETSLVTTVSTRGQQGTQRSIGAHINTLLLDAHAIVDAGAEAIARSRQSFIERWHHRDYPFDLVASRLREQGLDPASACGFTWVGDLARTLPTLDGIELSAVDVAFPVAKADLWAYVTRIDTGYRITFEYDRRHFTQAQAQTWIDDFIATLRRITGSPNDAPVRAASLPAPGIAKRARATAASSPVIERPLFDDGTPPIMIQPRLSGLRLDAWMQHNRAQFKSWIDERGAVLLRGFDIADERALLRLLTSAGVVPMDYRYRSTPRREIESRIYSSTEYPAPEKIPQHHENAYTTRYPELLWFACLDDRFTGGCTPLSDGAEVHSRLDSAIRDEFIARGLRYLRRYDNRVDLSWQDTFQTSQRSDVEAACAERGIECSWLDDGTLETRQSAQVRIRHPVSGHEIWFNQAHLFFRAGQSSDDIGGAYPRHVVFEDGGEIPVTHIDVIQRCYEACEQRFTWSRGDVLVVDNLRYAHGRDPYVGTRRIVVAMSDASGLAP